MRHPGFTPNDPGDAGVGVNQPIAIEEGGWNSEALFEDGEKGCLIRGLEGWRGFMVFDLEGGATAAI